MIKNYINKIESEYGEIPEQVAHKLLKFFGLIFNEGEVEEDYTKIFNINFGGLNIYSDPYYNQISIDDGIELSKKQIENLIIELKTRIYQYYEESFTIRNKFKKSIFEKELKL